LKTRSFDSAPSRPLSVRPFRSSGLLLLLLFAAGSNAFAAGGDVEISQTCAVTTGCGFNDSPGFPVQFSNPPSSFVLTSDLVVPNTTTTAISLPSGSTLDLHGFQIRGPVSCTGKPAVCDSSGSGVGVYLNGGSIQNGTIRGMGGAGIYTSGTHVENVTIESNGGNGISAYGAEGMIVSHSRILRNGAIGITTNAGQPRGSLVTNCTIYANTGIGIDGPGTMVLGNMIDSNGGYGLHALVGQGIAPYGQNGFYNNNGGSANPQLLGGQSLGGNYCGDASC